MRIIEWLNGDKVLLQEIAPDGGIDALIEAALAKVEEIAGGFPGSRPDSLRVSSRSGRRMARLSFAPVQDRDAASHCRARAAGRSAEAPPERNSSSDKRLRSVASLVQAVSKVQPSAS